MRAHELAARLPVDSSQYKAVMAAAKFDLGEADKANALSQASSRSFFEIPSPISLFEIHYGDQVQWYLAEESDDLQGVVWQLFVLTSGQALSLSTISVLIYKVGGARVSRFDPKSAEMQIVALKDCGQDEQEIYESITALAATIEVFSCCNVATVEHQPPKFINSKRIVKGKVPFFSYRTLHITADTQEKSVSSGTHASPRLHFRRGHIRKFPDGKRFWVRATLVGDKSKGFLYKDYAV